MRRIEEQTSQPGRDGSQDARRGLRLVRGGDATPHRASRPGDAPAQPDRVRQNRRANREWEVSVENQAAAALDTFDARWVLAVRAADALEGSRAAVLRPEARSRLLTTARTMGLRPFDANLVLAIVQDAARQGQTPRDFETIDRLMLVGKPERTAVRAPAFWVVISLAASVVWAMALIWWLAG